MKQFWFKVFAGVVMVFGLGIGILPAAGQVAAYQDASTPTGILVTVIYSEQINVRSGPSTVFYPIIGHLNPGDVVPALGISPGREWIQITYSDGIGWVYASYVSIAGGELRIVEPPPTPTPLVTSTIDPTLAAAFNIQPTQTRMPTFTPPPPLEVPRFTDSSGPSLGASGIFIIVLGLLGGIGLLASFVWRR